MFQCLDIPDAYQFYRHYKNVKMISEKDIYQQWPKMELDEPHAAEWFPMVLSIIGDESDSFKGDVYKRQIQLCSNEVFEDMAKIVETSNRNFLTASESVDSAISSVFVPGEKISKD